MKLLTSFISNPVIASFTVVTAGSKFCTVWLEPSTPALVAVTLNAGNSCPELTKLSSSYNSNISTIFITWCSFYDAMTGFEMNEVNNFTEDSTSAGDTVTTVKTAPSDEDGGVEISHTQFQIQQTMQLMKQQVKLHLQKQELI
ncbi:hypothetical protein [Arcobacter arenosus]|uniref:hypothetical protein n=1 Tax=Arcobacter arenosus TaxID=2576037 RepID=UPI003BAA4131